MEVKIRFVERGLIVRAADKDYAIDGVEGYRCDAHVITHAHSDHLPRSLCGAPISSQETADLAALRGLKYEPKGTCEVELLDSGHILGSRAVLINGEVLYTGDFSLRDRAFLKAFRPPRAKLLIMEATYGRKEYVFESFRSLYARILNDVAKALSAGKAVVAIGYPLGKAQLLEHLLKEFGVVVHKGLEGYREVYKRAGVKLANGAKVIKGLNEVESGELAIIPSYVKNESLLAAKRAGCWIAEFTGWASAPWYKANTIADAAYPLSDHADFNELIELVRRVEPKKVFVVHGFAEDFAKTLRGEGYDAVALKGGQDILANVI